MKLRVPPVGGLIVAALLSNSTPSETAVQRPKPARQDYNSGEYLYRTFCASCHGESAKGDGPVSDILRRHPPDLTAIATRGVFPRDDMSAVIDGRKPVPGHGRTEMPVWGDVFRSTEGDEATARKRIDALVRYLESIQQRPGGRSPG